MDNKLTYIFLCSVLSNQPKYNGLKPTEGAKLISALAHKHAIPVTWILDGKSAWEVKEIISYGHSEFGDDVVIMIEPSVIFDEIGFIPSSKAEETVILRQRLPELVISEQKKVKSVLPWSDGRIICSDFRSPVVIQVLNELDCIGFYGYRWEDETSDKGCPWSFFFPSKDHYNIPNPSANGMVAIENSSLDLNAVFHTNNPFVFSANPRSLWMSGLCSDSDNSYGKRLFEEYLKNSQWNRFLAFVQELNAYDMEYESYDVYSKGTIAGLTSLTDSFFSEVESNDQIQAFSLSDAINFYRGIFDRTEACYMLFDSIISQQSEINFFLPPEPKRKPPYPLMFFYYDSECHLVFKEGQMTPVEIRNYAQPPFESRYYIEREIPTISRFYPSRDREKLIMEFEIESIKRMPYGLVIWDDHSMFNLVSSNARTVKWIGKNLLFMRLDLNDGLNRIEIVLSI